MSKRWYPAINGATCIECGACVKMYANGVYDIGSIKRPKVINTDGCIDKCHGCGNLCPTGSIAYVGDHSGWMPPNLKTNQEGRETTMNGMSTDAGCGCGCDADCGCNENAAVATPLTKTLDIDFLYLDLNLCERCIATGDTLDEALKALAPAFEAIGYSVTVNRVNITTEALATQYRFISSPTIRVNGVDICEDLVENECENCGDLAGCSVDCRVFVYEGKEYNQPPTAAIIEGILRVLYGPKQQETMHTYALPENLKKYFVGREKIMSNSRMSIFEPAMCCPTGLCGVGVDPELLRISTVLNTLEKKGTPVQRLNLTNDPMSFVTTQVISEQLMKDDQSLPITTVDGKIVITGRYPTNDEFIALLDLPAGTLSGEMEAPDAVKEETEEAQGGCGCDCEGGCC